MYNETFYTILPLLFSSINLFCLFKLDTFYLAYLKQKKNLNKLHVIFSYFNNSYCTSSNPTFFTNKSGPINILLSRNTTFTCIYTTIPNFFIHNKPSIWSYGTSETSKPFRGFCFVCRQCWTTSNKQILSQGFGRLS